MVKAVINLPIDYPGADVEPDPTWEVALLFPRQGQWTPSEYLSLTDDTNWLVEYVNGRVEVLTMPTPYHQLIVTFIMFAFHEFLKASKLGRVVPAPLRVKITESEYREPDIIVKLRENFIPSENRFWTGADLVVEVISEGDEARKRDTVEKRAAYAAIGIPEYWIVDPEARTVTVLVIEENHYREAGVYTEGEQATSVLLPAFTIDVSDIFNAADEF